MIDLTPLDVRKKQEDIPRVFRGYDPVEVDTFLEIVADRLEELVKENATLKERATRLNDQVESLEGREHAVHEALVTAQELSGEIGEQARREARILRREAEAEIRRVIQEVEGRIERVLQEADRLLAERREALRELARIRGRFLRSLRALLEKELDAVQAAEDMGGPDATSLDVEPADWREPLRRLWTEIELDEFADRGQTGGAEGQAGDGGSKKRMGQGELLEPDRSGAGTEAEETGP